jgi:hypothetical protein
MNLLWAALIVVGVTAVAIGSMLLVRRRAPEGSYFEDGDRAAGVFGVLATGLAVLLGFVVFLAFESLDTSRSGAKAEAQIVAEQFETAQLMACRRPRSLLGRACLLRPLGGAPRVAAHGIGKPRRFLQPLGSDHVRDPENDPAALGV